MYEINHTPIDPQLYAIDENLLKLYEMSNGRDGYINDSRREYLLGKLTCLNSHVAHHTESGRVAGLIVSEPRPNEGKLWIDCLAVMPEHRHQRIGSQLLRFAQHYALRNDLSDIELCAVNKTDPFYIKNGFKEAEDIPWRGLSKIYRKNVI